jgi:uncharacterized protein
MVNAYFLDTSALVKRYIVEIGTPWIQTITNPTTQNILLISRLTCVELSSAIARRKREATLTPDQATQLNLIVQDHFTTQYQIVELNSRITDLARELCDRQSLRAYDAVQLASALIVQPIIQQDIRQTLTFLSADNRLIHAAQQENLAAENPNQQP